MIWPIGYAKSATDVDCPEETLNWHVLTTGYRARWMDTYDEFAFGIRCCKFLDLVYEIPEKVLILLIAFGIPDFVITWSLHRSHLNKGCTHPVTICSKIGKMSSVVLGYCVSLLVHPSRAQTSEIL